MPVYFVAENEQSNYDALRVKVGLSKDVHARVRQLQTGSPYELALMGWIMANDDRSLEGELHARFADRHLHGEWFRINPEVVLGEIRSRGICGYIAVRGNAFEVVSYDQDGIPEFLGPWNWGDVQIQEFCPQCGCGCGLQYNENYGMERCMKCGIIDAVLQNTDRES